jgi:hypothetical protein
MTRVLMKDNLGTAAASARMPSPNIWGDCPIEAIRNGGVDGIIFEDDFLDYPLIGTQTTEIAHGRYKVFNTGSGTVAGLSTVNSLEIGKGVVAVTLDTANDSGSFAQSYPSFLLTSTAGKLWFEARLCYTPIVTNGIGWFIGLAETELWTLATGVPFNGGDAITNSASAIGFRKPEDDLTTFDTVYSDRATSFTAVGDGEGSVAAAYQWTKLGMVFDPEMPAASRIRFYQDNTELSTKVSNSTLTGLTNLDANALGLLFASVADTAGTSAAAYIDWWKCIQLG